MRAFEIAGQYLKSQYQWADGQERMACRWSDLSLSHAVSKDATGSFGRTAIRINPRELLPYSLIFIFVREVVKDKV